MSEQTPTDSAAPQLLQSPAQPGLIEARNQMLQWPGTADASEVQALIDTDFVMAFNSGSPDVWQPWQSRRLNELLRWLTQSLWWQQWTGLSPDSPRSLPLSEIPILTRKAMRDAALSNGGTLSAPNAPHTPEEHGQLSLTQTAGMHAESNNQALPIWLTNFQARMAGAHYRANHYQQGRDPGMAIATFSDQIPAHPGAECLATGSNWLLGENCYEGNAHWGRAWAAGDAASHARFLSANPAPYLSIKASLLSQLLDAFEADASITRPAIAQILTQGEPIDLRLRQRARAVLGARIADMYVCEEIGPIAVQCPHSSDEAPHYHLAVTNAVVQIVRKDKAAPTKFGYMADAGEHGRVILTGLHQFATPVLRQDTGDTARMFPSCPVCGNPTPTLADLQGSEHLRLRATLADGSTQRLPFMRLSGQDWLRMLGQVPNDYRLLQVEPKAVRVEVVLAAPASGDATEAVQRGLAEILSSELRYDLHVSERIDWPPEAPTRLRHSIESLLRDQAAGAKA